MPVDTERALRLVRLKKNSNFLTLPELLRADSSESQGLVRGVVSRRHKSSKWKRRQHRKDMGDVDWHVSIDAEGALRLVRLKKKSNFLRFFFFPSNFIPLPELLRVLTNLIANAVSTPSPGAQTQQF